MHPNNLSHEYPCQGDTWCRQGVDILTVTIVSPSGVIYYMKGISRGFYSKTKATLAEFQEELARLNLGKPHYCTTKYYHEHGCY